MKHIIFLFLIINTIYITAANNFQQNQSAPLQQQQRIEQALNKKSKNSHYNQYRNSKNNTRAYLNKKNQSQIKPTRTSHPR